MGLDTRAKGMPYDMGYHGSYSGYYRFLKAAAHAWNEEFGQLFDKWTASFGPGLSQADVARWNEICNDDLDILLNHSDCEGKFTPKECRKIYNVLKNLKSEDLGHNYTTMTQFNLIEHWAQIFKYCADRRVNLYFT